MARFSYSLFRLFVPTVRKPQVRPFGQLLDKRTGALLVLPPQMGNLTHDAHRSAQLS
jgi:hypothetical protein